MPGRPKVPPSSRIIDLLPSYRLDLRAGPQFSQKPASPATIETYLSQLRYFCAWLSPDGNADHCLTTVRDVTRQVIITYFAERRDQWAGNSILTAHIALSSFFKFCVSWDELEESPMAAVKTPRPEIKTVPIPTDDQIRKLLSTCERGRDFNSRRDYAILRLFISTGLRLSELTDLRVADIHLEAGTLNVQHGKRGKARVVAYGPQVARALSQYINLRTRHKANRLEYLWLGRRGRLSKDGVWFMIHSRASAVGLRDIHPHTFRHHFAHAFQEADGQPLALLQLGGWKDMSMLQQRYGAALAEERAVKEHHRKGIGEQF